MKRTRFWLLGAFILISALLSGAVIKRSQNPLYRSSRYPRTPALERFIFHLSSEMDVPIVGVDQAMLFIYEPVNNGFDEVLEYQVSPEIQFNLNVINFPNNAGGYGRTASLPEVQARQIQRLMRQLPAPAPPAKREDLLIVLLYKRSNSQLLLYDRRNPPPQLRQIIGILTDSMQKELDRLLPAQTIQDLPHLRSPLRPSTAQRAQN